MRHLAALDIGSNSVKITVVQAGDPLLRTVSKISKVTSLGQGFASRRLQPAAMERTALAIADEMAWLRNLSNDCRVVVAATSAVRDAENGGDFPEMVKRAAGLSSHPMLLNGDEEAEYTFAGAVGMFPKGTPVLNSDPGGGSTEVAVGTSDGTLKAHRSFNAGAVRWMERYDLENVAPEGACERCLSETTALFGEFAPNVPSGSRLSVSGGIPYCAACLAAGGHVTIGSPDYKVYSADIKRFIGILSGMDVAERRKVPGMIADRANVMLAALIILQSLLDAFGLEYYIPNPFGLRHGLLKALDAGLLEPQLTIS